MSIVGSRESDGWEMKVLGPNGFEGQADNAIPCRVLGRCVKCGQTHLFEGRQWFARGTKVRR